MDELKIESNFMKGVINKIVGKILKKKLSSQTANFMANEVDIRRANGATFVHLSVVIELSDNDIMTLLKEASLI